MPRVRYIDNDIELDQHFSKVHLDGRTQFVPMVTYRHRERNWWIRFHCTEMILYSLAVYGLYRLIEAIISHGIPSLLWKLL